MHCPNCGQKTSAELKFCRSCGMKLDSVARALSSHLEGDEPEAAVEKSSAGAPENRFYSAVVIGMLFIFASVGVGLLGKEFPGVKMVAALLALLGIFITAMGFLPAAARFDRALFRSMGAGREPKRREKGSAPEHLAEGAAEGQAELYPGDDFEPASSASRIVPSVTEGTTRNLDGEKTKVLR